MAPIDLCNCPEVPWSHPPSPWWLSIPIGARPTQPCNTPLHSCNVPFLGIPFQYRVLITPPSVLPDHHHPLFPPRYPQGFFILVLWRDGHKWRQWNRPSPTYTPGTCKHQSSRFRPCWQYITALRNIAVSIHPITHLLHPLTHPSTHALGAF